MRSLLLALCAVVLAVAGCSSKYKVDAYEGPTTRLSREASFYVMIPRDGRYGATTYAGSGLSTAQAAVAALSAHVAKTAQAEAPEDLPQAMKKAQAAGLTHVFEVAILNWEDHATEWSGKPDRITLKMAVHEVATGKVVGSTVARASSKWGTFGGDHPQDLLPVQTQQFVGQLF